jgi:hypothetical protein
MSLKMRESRFLGYLRCSVYLGIIVINRG